MNMPQQENSINRSESSSARGLAAVRLASRTPLLALKAVAHLWSKVAGHAWSSMAESPYLIALALLKQHDRRLLPLAGKSMAPAAQETADPGEDGRALALELLLRIWQRSDEGAVKRMAGDTSLLLVEMPLALMSERLPVLKASWVGGGDTATFLTDLQTLMGRAWRLSIARYEPVLFTPWP